MWDYGSLNEHQELEYVHAKMAMLSTHMSDLEAQSLAELIVESQKMMRKYAFKQLCKLNVPKKTAQLCAKSSVSQRDIQRVFVFYKWFMHTCMGYIDTEVCRLVEGVPTCTAAVETLMHIYN